jgi:hypothetical protein
VNKNKQVRRLPERNLVFPFFHWSNYYPLIDKNPHLPKKLYRENSGNKNKKAYRQRKQKSLRKIFGDLVRTKKLPTMKNNRWRDSNNGGRNQAALAIFRHRLARFHAVSLESGTVQMDFAVLAKFQLDLSESGSSESSYSGGGFLQMCV